MSLYLTQTNDALEMLWNKSLQKCDSKSNGNLEGLRNKTKQQKKITQSSLLPNQFETWGHIYILLYLFILSCCDLMSNAQVVLELES